jgi:Tfp pilus assembly protein PilF
LTTDPEREGSLYIAEAEGPRFDLRFDAGRGLLRLSRPLPAAIGRTVALELALGRVSFPVDVTRGASAFRHRRTQVRSGSFRVELSELGRAAEARGVRLSIGDTPDDDAIAVGLSDDFGCLGLDVVPFVEGRDLCFAVRSHRAVTDGPSNPFRRIAAILAELGLSFDDAGGFFRLEQPARKLLARTLCTRGYRLPDDRGVDLSRPHRVEDAFFLTLGDLEPSDDEVSLAAAEEARFRAPVLARLRMDDVEGAADEVTMLVQRLEARRRAEPDIARRAIELGLLVDAERPGAEARVLDALLAERSHFAAATAVRLSLRIGDGRRATEVIQEMVSTEPLADLVVEGLSLVSGELSKSDPRAALALVSRAAARRPSDARLALERVELARRENDHEEIHRAAKKALGAALSSRDRARVASAAARAFERLGRQKDAERLYREALFASPDDPDALTGLAGLYAARGDRAAAVLRLDRAAAAHTTGADPEKAAAALYRAAELLARMGKLSAAEERLVRGLRHTPTAPALACALARVRAEVGDLDGAASAYDVLLSLEGHGGPALTHALVEAACFCLDDLDDGVGARPFVEMLARRSPSDSRLGPLMHRIERGERTVPGSIPAEARRRVSEADLDDEEDDRTDAERAPDVDGLAHTELVGLDHIGSTFAGDLTDPDALRALESRAEEPVRRATLARALSNALRRRGDDVEAARALARAGVLDRDMSAIRAALDLAERAKAPAAVREIVDRALTIVGEGPAREMLLRRRKAAEDDA